MALSKLILTAQGQLYAKKTAKGQMNIRIQMPSGDHTRTTITKEQRRELAHFLLEDLDD